MVLQKVEWSTSTYEEFLKYLLSLRSDKYYEFQQKLVPTVDNLIGIQVPVLRRLAREVSKGDVLQFIRQIKHEYYEENMIHGFVVGELMKDKTLTLSEKLQYIKAFIPYIDNWAVCDSFCTSLKVASTYPEEFLELILTCLKQHGEYEKRFGFVMLLNYYIEIRYMPLIFEYCSKYNNNDYYVKMAVAWLLSMCYVKEREKTLEFLRQDKLDDFTYRKTVSKIVESNQINKEEKQWVRSHLKR